MEGVIWLSVQIYNVVDIPLKDWVRNVLNKFWKEDGMESERGLWLCATMWSIWVHRNNVVFHQIKLNPYEILHTAEELVRAEKINLDKL